MKQSPRPSPHASDLDVRRASPGQQPLATDDQPMSAFPQPGEMLAESGLLLAIHLAVALAIAPTLRALGIA